MSNVLKMDDHIRRKKERHDMLRAYEGEDKVISSHEMLEKLTTKSPRRVIHLESGFSELDEYIDGFEGGELTTISGPTKNGKTLFAQSLTKNFADYEHPSLWFSYEVPAIQFLKQFGRFLPQFYMPGMLKGNAMHWLRDRIEEAKLKHGCEAVFIDHLHFIVDMATRNNMSLEIGNVMRQLKLMAIELNIAFFLVAHTHKVRMEPGTELDNDSLRDSSFIAQESDNVLMLWRSLKNRDVTVLKVTANRRRGVMDAKILLEKKEMFLVTKR